MAFSATYLPPTGFSFQTLVGIDPDSWLAKPDYTGNAGGEANNIGAGDQIIFKTLTNENGLTVELSDMGIISMLNADANTPNQTVDWYYFEAQEGYSAGALATLTLENAAGISIDFNAANETDAGLGVVIGTERAFNFGIAGTNSNSNFFTFASDIVFDFGEAFTATTSTSVNIGTTIFFNFNAASHTTNSSAVAIASYVEPTTLIKTTVYIPSTNHVVLAPTSRHVAIGSFFRY